MNTITPEETIALKDGSLLPYKLGHAIAVIMCYLQASVPPCEPEVMKVALHVLNYLQSNRIVGDNLSCFGSMIITKERLLDLYEKQWFGHRALDGQEDVVLAYRDNFNKNLPLLISNHLVSMY